jgi:hypothetical protein
MAGRTTWFCCVPLGVCCAGAGRVSVSGLELTSAAHAMGETNVSGTSADAARRTGRRERARGLRDAKYDMQYS